MIDQQDQTIKTVLREDGGFSIVVGVLQARRQKRKLSVARLSRICGVPVATIERIEAADFESARVKDLLLISKALGCHAGVALVWKREQPPKDNAAILVAYDKLARSRKAVVFVKHQPDKENAQLLWSAIGDKERNWLYVVCSHSNLNVRFGAVTENPGGWPIGSQWAGMDVETQHVMHRLAKRIFRSHRAELV